MQWPVQWGQWGRRREERDTEGFCTVVHSDMVLNQGPSTRRVLHWQNPFQKHSCLLTPWSELVEIHARSLAKARLLDQNLRDWVWDIDFTTCTMWQSSTPSLSEHPDCLQGACLVITPKSPFVFRGWMRIGSVPLFSLPAGAQGTARQCWGAAYRQKPNVCACPSWGAQGGCVLPSSAVWEWQRTWSHLLAFSRVSIWASF